MSDMALAAREGVRWARSAPVRSAIVAGTIAAASAAGIVLSTDGNAVALGCWALAVSTLVVARRSPRPERAASVDAWRRAGAGRLAIWLAAAVEALVVGVVPALAGNVAGTALTHARDTSAAFAPGNTFALWELVGLVLAACLPTNRQPRRRRSATRRVVSGVSVGIRVVVVVLALAGMFGSATSIRTNWDLGIAGFFIILQLVLVGAVVTGLASRWIVSALGAIRSCRALGAIAARYRLPGAVRLVIVTSVSIATVAAILGASVEARPETNRVLAQRLARMPALPDNVALVRLDAIGVAALDASASRKLGESELARLRAAISDVVPGAQLIELRDVGAVSSSFLCVDCSNGPVIVADARLRAIYGSDALYPPRGELSVKFLKPAAKELTAAARTRVPPRDALALAVHDGNPLPAATFANAVYYEVPQTTVNALRLHTEVRSVFVRASRPLTPRQSAGLGTIVRTWRAAPGTRLTLFGASGQLEPVASRPPPVPATGSLRHAAWAATSTASRWSLAAIASLFALIALLVALAIDTIDRRRDVQRLERIGATPAQVRGAAALYAAIVLTVVTWLDVALVVALTRAGIRAFNDAKPAIPVPFTVPLPIVLVLTIGLPMIGAAVAALIARPTGLERRAA